MELLATSGVRLNRFTLVQHWIHLAGLCLAEDSFEGFMLETRLSGTGNEKNERMHAGVWLRVANAPEGVS